MKVNEAIIDVEIGMAQFENRYYEDTCQFWVARTATMKRWNMTKRKGKSPPEGR